MTFSARASPGKGVKDKVKEGCREKVGIVNKVMTEMS
jgi:hypothetical protein